MSSCLCFLELHLRINFQPFEDFNSQTADVIPAATCSKPRRPIAPPHVLQIMQMGFTQASVELAMKRLAPAVPTVEQIVQWIIEHPSECPVVPSHPRSATFDGDSDSDSSDTVEGGSSINDGMVN